MTFNPVVCVTKGSSICVMLCKISAFYLFCHLSIAKISHSVVCTSQLVMQKLKNVTFASKPDFLPNFLQNSDFTPCIHASIHMNKI